MGNINERVKELNPHVLSIRFTEGLTVVDCAFKSGWTIPASQIVGAETTPEKPNYYMLYPLNEKIGIDEVLDYVSYVIKVNIEREMKINLLQIKINELKQLFTKSSLVKCKTIEFTFKTDLSVDLTEDINLDDMPIFDEVQDGEFDDKDIDVTVKDDGRVSPRNISSDDNINNVNPATAKFNNETFDLPPKSENIEVQSFEAPEVVCKCDPMDPKQMCPVCMHTKM